METKVNILLKTGAQPPSYMTEGSAGADLYAYLDAPLTLPPHGGVASIPTGVSLELPTGLEAQIRPRSGLARKHGVTVLNAPGTIDSERIAQLVIAPVLQATFTVVETLEPTERNQQGFGHTGK